MKEKRIAIMQPYFFPYIGYFHLVDAVDCFVIYDNIQYTKKGWINRNRFLHQGGDALFSLPLKKDSDFLNVDQRAIDEGFDRKKMLRRIQSAYSRAPYFDRTIDLFQDAIEFPEHNLFATVKHSLELICDVLDLRTPLVVSSTLSIDHELAGQSKILEICRVLDANCYVNAIGGTRLYDAQSFAENGLSLRFVSSQPQSYRQFDHPFVPWLSILDVMMFNSIDRVKTMIQTGYDLVDPPSNQSNLLVSGTSDTASLNHQSEATR